MASALGKTTPLWHIPGKKEGFSLKKLVKIYQQIGIKAGLVFLLNRALPLPSLTISLRHKNSKYPLWCRTGTSDINVFRLIFGIREYNCLDYVKNPSLIIDCGANVGYSSAYFLTLFPNAHVIAVEPDPENFEILKRNLAPYGDRVTSVCSAIWSKKTRLRFPRWPNATAHSVQVLEARAEEDSSLNSVTIDDLISNRSDRISILKVDIECAEKYVFAENYKSWLSRVDNIAIELHDEECGRVFQSAISEEMFQTFQHGELTVCKR